MALVLAAMMVLGMSSVASAADPVTTEVPITKTIYFYNEDGVTVYEPDITYTYTVSAGQGGASVTDNAGHTGIVTAGRIAAFSETTISINFDPNHAGITADADGAAVTKLNVFSFDPVALKYDGENQKWYGESGYSEEKASYRAGIYRYIITENTTENAVNAVGIKRDENYDSTLILDIFVTNEGEVTPVIHEPGFDDDDDIDNTNRGDETGKTTGFGDGGDPTDGEEPSDDDDPTGQKSLYTNSNFSTRPVPSDYYKTYNVTINKQVEGGMGDKSHKFPFVTVIENSITSAKFTAKIADAAATTQLVSAGVPNGSIKHEENIVITGLPSVVADTLDVKVTETNDTADAYKVKAIFNGNTASPALAEATVSANTAASQTAAMNLTTESSTVENKVVFTNTLDEVSPTGLILRFGPYLAMLAAGVALFVIFFTRRRKNEEE